MTELCYNATYDADSKHDVKRGCRNINDPYTYGNCPSLGKMQSSML